jgi:PAS domain S-box-containing protein
MPTTTLLAEQEESHASLQRLEAALERNLRMFEALVGASQEGITLTSADGRIIRIIRGILGYAPNSLAGTQIADLAHPEDRDMVLESYRHVVLGRQQRIQCEVRLVKVDGSYLQVELTINDMLDNPAVMAIVCTGRDISLRRRRHMTEAELDVLSDHASVAVFSVDRDGVLQTWHPACERLLGYTAAEMADAQVHSLISPACGAPSLASVMECGKASQPIATQLLARGGKPIPVELILSPLVLGDAVQGVAWIVRSLNP